MSKRKYFIIPILFTLFFASCTYENIEEYYSETICDTINVTYSGTVYPIIERNCLGCHYTGNSTGLNLESYEDVLTNVNNGKLLGSIRHEAGFSPMPKGGKLDDCSISKIEKWVDDGASEN